MPSSLAEKVRAKFPGAYDDMDDAALEKSVLAKHPEYQDLATPPTQADSPLLHRLNEQEGPAPKPDWKANLAGALEPLAHPQTAGDFGGLLIPSGGAEVVGKALAPVGRAISKYGGAAAKLAASAGSALLPSAVVAPAKAAINVLSELKPSEWNSPLTVAGREGRAQSAVRAFNEQPLAVQMRDLPATGPMPEGRTGTPPASDYRFNDQPLAVQQQHLPATGITGSLRMSGPPLQAQTPFHERPLYQQMQDLMEAPTAPASMRGQAPPIRNLGNEVPPPAPTGPTGPHMDRSIPMRPSEMTPQQLKERVFQGSGTPQEAPPKPMLGGRLQMTPTGRPPITVSPESPMQAPRATVGAEVVGRQNGMTTQQVRDTTGPIRGEAQGTAAGMPSAPKDRIVQKLIDMGPKGAGLPEAEREAYAAAGTSDKTRLQVQAYLDALRKVGFVLPVAGGEAVRRAVMAKLGQEQQ